MTNFLLLIGLLAPSVHTLAPPAQPTSQIETKPPLSLPHDNARLALRMSTKEVVEALGQPALIDHAPALTFYFSGQPCALNQSCFVRFDDSGHAVAFFDFTAEVL